MFPVVPTLATVLINTYREPAIDGECILSQEGPTQGDPLAMQLHALDLLPLIWQAAWADTVQSWFADYFTGAGRLRRLGRWWHVLRL